MLRLLLTAVAMPFYNDVGALGIDDPAAVESVLQISVILKLELGLVLFPAKADPRLGSCPQIVYVLYCEIAFIGDIGVSPYIQYIGNGMDHDGGLKTLL